MRNLEAPNKSKLLIAAALAGMMMASCAEKPDAASEVATQQLVEATQKAEEAALRAETAQKALEAAQAEQAAAEAKAAADAEQAAAEAKLKEAQDRATAAERESAAAKKRAATAERQAAAKKPASTYTEARPAATPAPAPVCQDCGTVASITPIKVKGKGTGMGAVAGAIAGIAAGNQIGDGKGTDVAKVVGAIGGAYAGNQAEKAIRADTVFDVTVRMDNGTSRTVRVADASSVSNGSRVRVNGANLERM